MPTSNLSPNILHSQQLPAPRQGDSLYFANARSLFFGNEGAYRELEKNILSLDSYGGRLVPLISALWDGDSHLVLERAPAPSLMDYFTSSLEMKLPELIVSPALDDITPEITELAIQHDLTVDGLIVNDKLSDLARVTDNRISSSVRGCELGNNKHALHHFLVEVGLPTFSSHDAHDNQEVAAAAATLLRDGYRYAVAKCAVGASGVGLVKFSTYRPETLDAFMFESAPCLIQGWLDPEIPRVNDVISPSVQFLITDEDIHFYDVTDQILSGSSVHEGNVSPPQSFTDDAIRAEMLRQSEISTRWLYESGYRGLGSVDFHIALTDDGFETRICEINARATGASYPSYLSRQMVSGDRATGVWLMQNFRYTDQICCSQALEDMSAAGLLYQKEMHEGVIPINFNLTSDNLVNKGQFLFMADDIGAVHELADRFIDHAHLIGARG